MGHHKSKLSPKALSELVNSTYFSESEIKEWYKAFLRDCPSGLLTVKEFKKCCSGFFESGDCSDYAERAFRYIPISCDRFTIIKRKELTLKWPASSTFLALRHNKGDVITVIAEQENNDFLFPLEVFHDG